LQGEFRKLKDGYGFIAGEDGIDYFFHWQGLSKFTKQFRYCKEGEKVDFDVEVQPRGPRAINVKVSGYTILTPISQSISNSNIGNPTTRSDNGESGSACTP
jgi:cold shock CspA family protein